MRVGCRVRNCRVERLGAGGLLLWLQADARHSGATRGRVEMRPSADRGAGGDVAATGVRHGPGGKACATGSVRRRWPVGAPAFARKLSLSPPPEVCFAAACVAGKGGIGKVPRPDTRPG